ncbi:MAG TPA: hypothetical protein VMT17_09650 [Anaeromyxobacteraceae bacterium]|nr:hypothetical protein [Anaeromyxobacteraceae bacterium]
MPPGSSTRPLPGARLPALALAAALSLATAPPAPALPPAAVASAKAALVARHGEAQRARVERGVDQVALYWRPSDGDPEAFRAFVEENFLADPAAVEATLARLEDALESIDGHAAQVNRDLARHAVLDLGPQLPVDALSASFDAGAHVTDDLFASRLAFVALLNFPLTTLDERLRDGPSWARARWAKARLVGRRGALVGSGDAGISARVPAEAKQAAAKAQAAADAYIADYNVWAHHLVEASGARLFPSGKRLLSHWNLRDEIKASYALPDGLARQRALARVMERIATQEIPLAVVNNPAVDWNPFTNEVRPAPAAEVETGARPPAAVAPDREPDTRYARFLDQFHAARQVDASSPGAPTAIARKFEVDREIPEARVEAMLEEILSSPLVPRVAKLIEKRLGRPLEPFDIWYAGFRPAASHSETDLDALTRKRYPTPEAYAKDMPRMFEALGFSPERARFLAAHIVVDPARGSGHALQAAMRGDNPHLRTRVGKDGMDYKGYNIAVHEMGHNVEQVFSLYEVDHVLLSGVPNTSFTEALAFVFQARDLELLGLGKPTAVAERLLALDAFWGAFEIAGVALVDLRAWKWLYAHPEATAAELRAAVVGIARDVWNRYYAPVFRAKDVPLLAIYSHMIQDPLYLADYVMGHAIAAQLEEAIRREGRVGPVFEKAATFGSLPPDQWMRNATGEPLSTRALLDDARRALAAENG